MPTMTKLCWLESVSLSEKISNTVSLLPSEPADTPFLPQRGNDLSRQLRSFFARSLVLSFQLERSEKTCSHGPLLVFSRVWYSGQQLNGLLSVEHGKDLYSKALRSTAVNSSAGIGGSPGDGRTTVFVGTREHRVLG